MHASLSWLNRLLEPGNLGVDEAEAVLTNAGFPIESRESLAWGDTKLDVEVTSNRGDCLSILGLAREVAAASGRKLKSAAANLPYGAEDVAKAASLVNETPGVCPVFTVRVVRGVKVGPSPAWLATLLESVGQRSINNVVDATNYINFELGNPCHAFDLKKLAGRALVVRFAWAGEMLTTLDGKARKLAADELVVADGERAQSLAGVMGGADAEVSVATTDLALEVATWDPPTVRRASRRHNLRTDASHRFERYVDPRTVEEASRRLAALVLEVAGGTLLDGVLAAGRAMPEPARLTLRPARCNAVLGLSLTPEEMLRRLGALAINASRTGDVIACEVPAWRNDLRAEIDLIEEVGRSGGLGPIPIRERVPIVLRPPQQRERAMRELAGVLTGLGFHEAVTFSFLSPARAAPFLPPGLEPVNVDDERRGAEPTCRPSVIPSLLACRRANQDAGNEPEGGVRLFEVSAVFAQRRGVSGQPESHEKRVVSLLMDAPEAERAIDRRQGAVRAMRCVVESLVGAMHGPRAKITIESATPAFTGVDPGAFARVMLGERQIGCFGLVSPALLAEYGLDRAVAAAEIDAEPLLAGFPPRAAIEPLASFPAIERDLSLIVAEGVTWDAVRGEVLKLRAALLEDVAFVYTYRGKQFGAGKKSLTLRLRFRDPARTLRHEEVDPQVEAVAAAARGAFGAEIRSG